MKKQNAMSLIGVIIAIIFIIMIICGAIYFTMEQFEKSRIENVKTNMLLVQGKIKVLQGERGWSDYKLAQKANIPIPTLNSLFTRNSPPKLETLQCIWLDALAILFGGRKDRDTQR